MISINSIMESEENNDLMGLLLLCQHISVILLLSIVNFMYSKAEFVIIILKQGNSINPRLSAGASQLRNFRVFHTRTPKLSNQNAIFIGYDILIRSFFDKEYKTCMTAKPEHNTFSKA